MPDIDLQPSERAVFVLLEGIALALAFAGAERLLAGDRWFVSVGAWIASFLFSYAGAKWPEVKQKVGLRFSSGLETFANHARYRIGAIMLVILYVVLTGLYYVHSLRSDIDAYIMPRILTARQADDLRDFSSHHELPSPNLTVKVNGADDEAQRYSGQLLEALKRAGWNAEWDTGDPRNNAMNTLNNGLCIGERGKNVKANDPKNNPEQILAQALQAANIEVTCTTGGGDGEYGLFLLVGHRPVSTRPKVTWRRKLAQWLTE